MKSNEQVVLIKNGIAVVAFAGSYHRRKASEEENKKQSSKLLDIMGSDC